MNECTRGARILAFLTRVLYIYLYTYIYAYTLIILRNVSSVIINILLFSDTYT